MKGIQNPFRYLFLLMGTLCLSVPAPASSLEELERIASQASSLRAFLASAELVAQYRKALVAYTGGDRFRCESFDDILVELTRLTEQVPHFGERLWKTPAQPEVIRAAEFSTSRQGRVPGTPWSLRPIPRPFHGIWIDPSQQGCVDPKNCSESHAASPRRWAMALDGAKMFLVEKGDAYQGSSIILLPLRGKGARWNLVVASGSSVVHRRGYFRVGRGAIRRLSLLDIWREKYKDPFPLTELSFLPNDEKVARLVSLGEKKPLGFLSDFAPGDPISALIEEASPRQCHRASLPDLGWNVFAGFNATGELATPSSTGTPILDFKNAGQVKEFLLSVNPYEPGALDGVAEENLPQLQDGLADALSDPNPKVRENAAVTINLLRRKKGAPAVDRQVAAKPQSGPATSPLKGSKRSTDPFVRGLRKALNDPVPPVRDAAARTLADIGDKSPEVNNALSDSINRPGGAAGPGFPFPGGGGSGGGLSPLERARRGIDSKLRNGLPISEDELGNLLDRAQRSGDPEERRRAGETLGRVARNPQSRDEARTEFQRRCTGRNADPEFCRSLVDQINTPPEDPEEPGVCTTCIERARRKAERARQGKGEGST